MLHIAICDDEKTFVNHLKELLSQYMLETGEEIKTSVFYDGLDLIEKYDPSFDLIFLDIQMKMVDGLHAAEKIRGKRRERWHPLPHHSLPVWTGGV